MFKLLGYKKVNYTRPDGSVVKGYRIYGAIPDDSCVGNSVCTFWVSGIPDDIEIGMFYNIVPRFDKDGHMSVANIVLAGEVFD